MKQLHQKTQIEVQSLLNETGHALTLDDIADVLELDDLAQRVTGRKGEISELHRWPVKCGKLLLRPLTLGKIAWYNQCASVWFEEDDETLATLLAFLLSVDNDESFVWSLTDPHNSIQAINEWQKLVDCTTDELQAGIAAMVHSDEGSKGVSNNASDDGPLIAMLCREYGNSPDHWLYKESISVIRALCDDYTLRMNDEIRKHNASMKGSRGKSSPTPPLKTPSMDAGLKFRQKIESIRARWSNDG